MSWPGGLHVGASDSSSGGVRMWVQIPAWPITVHVLGSSSGWNVKAVEPVYKVINPSIIAALLIVASSYIVVKKSLN